MIKTATLILLIVFAVVSLIHLIFCALEMEKARKITKPFCLAVLLIASIVESPESFIIYIGILCGLIGDIFLIENKNPKRFIWGTAFFSIGHLCYLLEMVLTVGIVNIEWYAYVITLVLYLAFSITTTHLCKSTMCIASEEVNWSLIILNKHLIIASALSSPYFSP